MLVIFTYRGSSVSVFCVRTGFSCVNYTIQPFCRNKHSCITESIILKAPYTSLLEACKKPISEIFHLIAIDIFIYICFGNLEWLLVQKTCIANNGLLCPSADDVKQQYVCENDTNFLFRICRFRLVVFYLMRMNGFHIQRINSTLYVIYICIYSTNVLI